MFTVNPSLSELMSHKFTATLELTSLLCCLRSQDLCLLSSETEHVEIMMVVKKL